MLRPRNRIAWECQRTGFGKIKKSIIFTLFFSPKKIRFYAPIGAFLCLYFNKFTPFFKKIQHNIWYYELSITIFVVQIIKYGKTEHRIG